MRLAESMQMKQKQRVTASGLVLAKVQVRLQEIYEPSAPNVFTLCHPSVSLIYLFADSQQKTEKAKVADQIKMQVLLECTSNRTEPQGEARWDKANCAELSARNGRMNE